MSKIAPGKWQPEDRQETKRVTRFLGIALMAVGLIIGVTLTREVIASENDPSVWVVALVSALALIPFILGCVAVFPKIEPLVYRLLDEIDGRRQEPND